VCQQSPDDAVLALHEVEVRVTVPPSDRHPGDEMVDDEVVQDDDSGSLAQCVDDPGVCVGVVPDVVEREVRPARSGLLPPADDRHVDPLPERGEQERAVVRDARLLWRHRAEVRDVHASSLPMPDPT
jgi:hypothetical protein